MGNPYVEPSPDVRDLLGELHNRQLVRDVTEGLGERLRKPISVYYGVSTPTAPSLHHGNLIGLLNLRRFAQAGHDVNVVIGSATALIGDPSGRNTERPLLEPSEVGRNASKIAWQIRRIVGSTNVQVFDNASWTSGLSLIDFLRDVGKHATVSQMLAKESVQRRLADGLSFTEFAYMLLQAHDYAHLYGWDNVELQIGGSDQWGNMLAGVDLIRKRTGSAVHALSWPLLVDDAGAKIGKTAGAKLWLDPELTTPYAFYQAMFNTPDDNVRRMLAWYTLLPVEVIDAMCSDDVRTTQEVLAFEATRIVHGSEQATHVAEASHHLFAGDVAAAGRSALEVIASEIPTVTGPAEPIDALVEAGLATSKRDARRLVDEGAVHVTELLHGRWVLIRKGKKHWMAVDHGL